MSRYLLKTAFATAMIAGSLHAASAQDVAVTSLVTPERVLTFTVSQGGDEIYKTALPCDKIRRMDPVQIGYLPKKISGYAQDAFADFGKGSPDAFHAALAKQVDDAVATGLDRCNGRFATNVLR